MLPGYRSYSILAQICVWHRQLRVLDLGHGSLADILDHDLGACCWVCHSLLRALDTPLLWLVGHCIACGLRLLLLRRKVLVYLLVASGLVLVQALNKLFHRRHGIVAGIVASRCCLLLLLGHVVVVVVGVVVVTPLRARQTGGG